MNIREAEIKDYGSIDTLVRQAFSNAECSDGKEQDLVKLLRKSHAFIPELSLIAEINGKVVGYIMFTEANVNRSTVLALAPLAVLPDYQKKGIGTALIQAGHQIAQKMGYEYSVVLGSEAYYPRLGYIPADNFGIRSPFDVPRKNFMAYKLKSDAGALNGIMTYAPEFGIR